MKIAIGSIVYGKGGIGSQVVGFNDDLDRSPIILTQKGELKYVPRSKILRVDRPAPLNPRLAVSHVNGRVEVDLDKIDLDYCSSIPTPPWSPTSSVRPQYEQLTKIYLDIETDGLNPDDGRIYMVGMINEDGVKVVITDPDEKVLLTKTIAILKQKKPNCLIGHNLFIYCRKNFSFFLKECKNRVCTLISK